MLDFLPISRSAFFWFCNDERTKVKALNPEYGVGDIAKELGKKWSDVGSEVKSKYEAMAENDKKRYERVSVQPTLQSIEAIQIQWWETFMRAAKREKKNQKKKTIYIEECHFMCVAIW